MSVVCTFAIVLPYQKLEAISLTSQMPFSTYQSKHYLLPYKAIISQPVPIISHPTTGNGLGWPIQLATTGWSHPFQLVVGALFY